MLLKKFFFRPIYYFIRLSIQTSSFIYRAFKLRYKLTPIDKQSPFKGELGKSGVFNGKVSQQTLNELKNLFKVSKKQDDLNNSEFSKIYKVHLKKENVYSISEIFTIINPIVKQYFGENIFLDGIHLSEMKPNYESLSGKWHVDNVGNRIKCFICIEGDGSQPTFVVPSKERVPSFKKWVNDTFMQSLRWAGVNSVYNLNSSIRFGHKDGTLFMFDTLLLHRGGYEKAEKERAILHLEFSNPKKLGITKITFDYNCFSFDEDLLNIDCFSSLINTSRILRDKTSGVYNYVPSPIQNIK